MRILHAFFAVAALSLTACSSQTTQPTQSTQSTAPPEASEPPMPHALRADVMPILFQSCSSTGCHGSQGLNKGLYVSCCDTNAAATQVHADVLKDSRLAPGLKLVVPGDPAKSFLMMKLDDRQNQLDGQCHDPDGVLPAGSCGESMPQGTTLSITQRAIVWQWIADGAKDD